MHKLKYLTTILSSNGFGYGVEHIMVLIPGQL
jgi:hypothetical protein